MRLRHQFEARRQFERFVAVRHPDGEFLGQSLKQNGIRNDVDFRAAVLALVRRAHFAAERVHHELQSVADAEHGHAQVEDARVGGRRVFVVDRPWRARKDDADGRVALTSSSFAVHGSTTEKTFCSRMRRAMSCVYCAPKSRMTMDWLSEDD